MIVSSKALCMAKKRGRDIKHHVINTQWSRLKFENPQIGDGSTRQKRIPAPFTPCLSKKLSVKTESHKNGKALVDQVQLTFCFAAAGSDGLLRLEVEPTSDDSLKVNGGGPSSVSAT